MKKQEKKQSQYHQILFDKKHQFAVNHFIDNYNSTLGKQYKHVEIDKIFGQYVHTRMHMYHLTTNNGDKITALLSIYQFDPKEIHGYVDYVYTGHMKPLTAQKKLIQLENWPSCGAFGRSQSCDIQEAQNKLYSHLSEINEKLQLQENSYEIVRCWSQCVQGTNYFMHVVSDTGKKASIAMYVPFDDFEDQMDQMGQMNQQGNRVPQKRQNGEDEQGQGEDLKFQITFCTRGHVNYG